jgi:DNA-binding response OmpR family regulator
VEDNPSDVFLIREALKLAEVDADVEVAIDGEIAIETLTAIEREADAELPDMLILDINLPRRKGSDVLRHLRMSSRFKQTKVLVVTSSDSSRDREEMSALGSHAYFRKPSNYAGFMKLGALARDLLKGTLPS